MTIDEFIQQCRERLRGRWRRRGVIRRRAIGDWTECPVCALDTVVNNLGLADRYYVAWRPSARRLGLSEKDGLKIVDAADLSANYDRELRERLIEALGE